MFDVINKGTYFLEKEEFLPEMNGTGYLLRHSKTKARVVVVTSEDKNKVFNIGFKTPPSDDTGVPHILEHSVLCGSKNFPLKDPFVELVKGSLNTFLNAMTYPDKTVYPVASCNDTDFHNMMHVYLDAVLYPNIYKEPKILMQEGWHYELDSMDGELTYNGVVYNEMKGVFSSGDDILARRIQDALLPDTAYGCESGGDPDFIPNLTQEDFIAFHKKYYHPSNSYIYLYGDMDVDKELAFIDEEYLSHFDYLEVNADIPFQKPFDQPVYLKDVYSISEEENEKDNTFLSYNVVVGDSLDRELYLAFQILGYVLFGMPGAQIKKALLDAKIGKDLYHSYDNGIQQPVFSVIVNNSNPEEQDRFIKLLEEEFAKAVKEGLDEKVLRAAINYFEFKYKESNFGRYPKGLIYGLQMYDSWLYDDEKPFIHIHTGKVFSILKERIGTGYFESLIQKYFLDNNHKAFVMIEPEKGLTGAMEEKIKEKLAAYKAGLSDEEKEEIIKKAEALRIYQDEPSRKEDIEKIPLLSIDDIEKKTEPIAYEKLEAAGAPVIYVNEFTNGIAYLKLAFSLKNLPFRMLPYAAMLANVYRLVDTDHFTYQELTTEINLNMGGWGTDTEIIPLKEEEGSFLGLFEVGAKGLYDQIANLFTMTKEIIFKSHITDKERLREIISQMKNNLQQRNNQAGHAAAANRALSYFSQSALAKEMMDGIDFYEFIKDLEENFEERYESLAAGLLKVREMIFTKNNLMISYTADEIPMELLTKEVEGLYEVFYEEAEDCGDNTADVPADSCAAAEEASASRTPIVKNEGFKTSSKVQYNAKAGNFLEKGFSYHGALKALHMMFSFDYLWQNIRVKGGAYGCMCGFTRLGNAYFTSYRDPNLSATLDVYKNAWKFVENFTADERDMTKYIIGAIGNMDAPVEAPAKGMQMFRAWLMGVTTKLVQKERDELLTCTPETIRSLAPLIKAAFEDNIICVIGNENKLEEERELFKELKSIF
ncbi:MAG: insulinase family protein [Lachnospiraceae bacterium]|nr:insulinase family protein [Lachnospiraceae bacterium]